LQRFLRIARDPHLLKTNDHLRTALLDFIADFADLKNATRPDYLRTARLLTAAAHSSAESSPTPRPVVLDPFAGGGSIPFEALRIGADAFATDLNPIPVLLNKVLIEFVPRYGSVLLDEFHKAMAAIGSAAQKQLQDFYPADADGSTPVAYVWAKTINCEGPGCGATVPMMRSPWLSKTASQKVWVSFDPESGRRVPQIAVTVHEGRPPTRLSGTVRRGSVTCPCCGYTTPRSRVEQVAQTTGLGERLLAVVSTHPQRTGRTFRAARTSDQKDVEQAEAAVARLSNDLFTPHSTIPDEPLPYLRSIFNVHVYGVHKWASLFNPRQLLSAITFASMVRKASDTVLASIKDDCLRLAVATLLALACDRLINALNRTCYWNATGPKMQAGFARQAIPMLWDYCEANPFGGSVGSWASMEDCVTNVFKYMDQPDGCGDASQCSATQHSLPDDSVDAVVTDPPYYDAVPYADLSDFFYVWLKRMLGPQYPGLFGEPLAPKRLEVVQLAERNPDYAYKTKENFEDLMWRSMAEARRIAKPQSVSVVVFAHQSTAGWEAMLEALVRAGWVVTASWAIDTEMPTRVRARDSAVLSSSIHLVCRPREKAGGELADDDVGDWRTVLAELPGRIHHWLPHLADEGIVGADAIFACLGPALEIFSRYSRVEKASGEVVTLREYLEQVWAAVSTEALSMIFRDADAAGLESDARFTAIVLWTLGAGGSSSSESSEGESEDAEEEDDEDDSPKGKAAKGGYTLEYDAARKIAQGLGVNLEQIDSVVEVKGDKARLRPVNERAAALFGKADKTEAATKKRGRKATQKKLFDKDAEEGGGSADTVAIGEGVVATPGATALDRVHQAMLLFASGRADALKRFIVEDGIGGDARFWKLAQSLSALYPAGSDEKRWVDGVLARKKSFGF
jgi:adenine-specific DNA methylase